MIDILMPTLSPTMEEGALAKWHVKPGDRVVSGQIIAEVETDKATMEVEAVDEGVIGDLLVAEGTQGVPVNTPIARLGDASSAATAQAVALKSVPAAVPAPTLEPAQAIPPEPAPRAAASSADGAEGAHATPLAARMARSAGVALDTIGGSCPSGRITRADVERTLGLTPRGIPATAPSGNPAPAFRPSLEQTGVVASAYDLVPLDGMRRTIAKRMSESFREVPHFPLTVDVELDAFLALRQELNAILGENGQKASLNDMIIKAAAVALKRVPEANASFTPDGIAMHLHADIAVAVAVDGGLITPIVRAAEEKGVGQISREMKDLADRARSKKLAPEEFQGGTFTISNLGMFGIKSFSSILNEPQGAILSVGAGEKRAVVRDGALGVATVMTVTLTCDHRALDGAIGAKWIQTFKSMVEIPLGLIV